MAIARHDLRVVRCIDEIKELVLVSHPEAKFLVADMPDSDDGVVVWAYVAGDHECLGEDVVTRQLEMLVDDGVFISLVGMPMESYGA